MKKCCSKGDQDILYELRIYCSFRIYYKVISRLLLLIETAVFIAV